MARRYWFLSVLVVLLALVFFSIVPDKLIWGWEIHQANALVVKIKAFHHRQGKLPTSLRDVGMRDSEEGPFYYQKCSDTRFLVWFGTSLGESMTYDSSSDSWDAINHLCNE